MLLDNFQRYYIIHIAYQTSMTYKSLGGVFEVDRIGNVYLAIDTAKVVCTINVRAVLYAMKMLDGRPLFVEIHQLAPIMNVNVVVGKTEEAHCNKLLGSSIDHKLYGCPTHIIF